MGTLPSISCVALNRLTYWLYGIQCTCSFIWPALWKMSCSNLGRGNKIKTMCKKEPVSQEGQREWKIINEKEGEAEETLPGLRALWRSCAFVPTVTNYLSSELHVTWPSLCFHSSLLDSTLSLLFSIQALKMSIGWETMLPGAVVRRPDRKEGKHWRPIEYSRGYCVVSRWGRWKAGSSSNN